MNRKLIAAAVSAAVIAPVAAQAESSFYARVNTAIDMSDLKDPADPKSGESTTHLSNVASRFGFKGSSDLGNGLTAHGHYEFAVTSDKEQDNVDDARIATVGLSGGFGRVDVGNQWSAYFNTFGTLISPTYTLGYYMYSSIGQAPYRASNTIQYSNSFGPLSAVLDIRLNDDNTDEDVGVENENKDSAENQLRGDGIGLGLTYAVTDNITIAAAFDSEERPDNDISIPVVLATGVISNTVPVYAAANDVDATSQANDADRIGLAVKADLGPVWVSAGWQNFETADVEIEVPISGTDTSGTNIVANTTASGKIAGADVDTMFLWVGGNISEKTNWNVGYAKANDGRDDKDTAGSAAGIELTNADLDITDTDDSEQLTWGIYHNMGGGLRLYYEATSLESENNKLDGDRHLLGMRFDF